MKQLVLNDVKEQLGPQGMKGESRFAHTQSTLRCDGETEVGDSITTAE